MPVHAAWASLSALFDKVYSERRQRQLDRLVADVSVVGFIAHLALVFLARTLTSPPALIAAVGKSYLSAIYTPFSFILFYEVLMLIAALPRRRRNPSPSNTDRLTDLRTKFLQGDRRIAWLR